MLEQDRKFASCFCFVMISVCLLLAMAFWVYIDEFWFAVLVSGSFAALAVGVVAGYAMIYVTDELINDEHEDNAV
jgi:hypothetical protein